jgi:hypothetical protein
MVGISSTRAKGYPISLLNRAISRQNFGCERGSTEDGTRKVVHLRVGNIMDFNWHRWVPRLKIAFCNSPVRGTVGAVTFVLAERVCPRCRSKMGGVW